MSGYDSWLLCGSDDCPPDPPTLREIRRALRASPHEFCMEGDERQTYMVGNPARRCSVPNSARARRIRLRIFHRLDRVWRRKFPPAVSSYVSSGDPYIDDLDC